MRRAGYFSIAFGGLIFLLGVPVWAGSGVEDAPKHEPVFVLHPFATPASVDAFRQYVADLSVQLGRPINVSADFLEMAPTIDYWGYEFSTNSIGTVDVTFVQKFDSGSFLSSFVGAIDGIRKGGCSHFHAKNARVTTYQSRRITVQASIDGKKRACTDLPLIGEVKTDLGDIGGSAIGTITYRTDATEDGVSRRYNGAFVSNPPAARIEAEVESIFGINSNSVVGQVLNAIGKIALAPLLLAQNPFSSSVWRDLNFLNGTLWRAPEVTSHAPTYALANGGAVQSSQYREFLANLTSATWSIQPGFSINESRTGFGGTTNDPVLEIAYTATLKPHFPFSTVLADIESEIRLLASFGEQETAVVTKPGDSLWKIAAKHYGNPYLHNMLAVANGIGGRKQDFLPVAAKLRLPPLYKLYALHSARFIEPGDTVWGLCSSHYPDKVSTCMRDVAKLNPHLDISRIYALEPLIIPEKTASVH